MRKEFVEREEICFPIKRYEETKNGEEQGISKNC